MPGYSTIYSVVIECVETPLQHTQATVFRTVLQNQTCWTHTFKIVTMNSFIVSEIFQPINEQ